MKKNLMQKVFAVSMSIAMACTLIPATSKPVTASAAAPYVNLRTNFKTLKVGGINTMTLKNNSLSWKITKVATNDRTIAMVYNRTEESFRIKGKSVGRTTVKARLKTTARKTSNSKLVSCRVKVIENEAPAVETSKEVSTQAELDAALADKNLTAITIKATSGDFTIADGTYDNIDLTVDAPNSDVTNGGTFKSITINQIKANSWFENAVGNAIRMITGGRIVVGPTGKLAKLTVAPTNPAAKVELNVNGGEVAEVAISAKVELNITGKSAVKIKVTIEATAKDTKLTSEVPSDVTAKADSEIEFKAGAQGSTVKAEDAGVKASVKNSTGTNDIQVTDANGKTQPVPNGSSVDLYVPVPTTPGGTTTVTPTPPVPGTTTTTQAALVSIDKPELNVTITTPTAVDITTAAIKFSLAKANESVKNSTTATTGSAIQYSLDGGTSWKDASDTEITQTITVNNTDEKVPYSFKYRIKAFGYNYSKEGTISYVIDLLTGKAD